MPIAGVGHPDFNAAVNTPVPKLQAIITGLPFGFSANQVVNLTSGGAYLIAVGNATANEMTFCDIIVNHYDTAGNQVHTDVFSGVYAGNDATFPISLGPPTICRGNIYGSTLKIQVNTAANAWARTIFGIGTLVVSVPVLAVYVIPNNLPDPEPIVYNGGPQNPSLQPLTPGAVLYSIVNSGLNHGVSTPVTPLNPFAGPVVLTGFQLGLTTTPSNLRFNMQSYSVTGGTSAQLSLQFATAFVTTDITRSLNLPAMLNTIQLANVDGAQNAIVWASVVAGLSA
jgi:hypothetical protein